MTDPVQRVRAIVVNHDGGALLERCIASLLALAWPSEDLDIVISDNASTDGSLEPFRTEPRVHIIENGANLGFGAAVNRALDAPGLRADAVLLLNPDAWIEPDALALLAHTLDHDGQLGAACPRIVFDRPMTEVAITSPSGMRPWLSATTVDGDDVFAAIHGLAGAHRLPTADDGSRWVLESHARFHVPHGRPIEVELDTRRAGAVEVTSGASRLQVAVERGPNRIVVDVPAVASTVIQNDGSDVDADGTGRNRHFHVPVADADDPNPVFAWCGAAVLLRTATLDQVGPFAEPFFLYYEDTDLAWRFQSAHWPPRVVTEAVVWHRHSASTGQGRAVTEIHQHRNRVLMMARNASLAAAARTLLGLAATTLSVTVRGAVGRLRGDESGLILAGYRWRALTGSLRLLPWALRSRRHTPHGARRA